MALTPYPRIWYRDTATNLLNGPLQQPARPPRGQDVVLETAIRGVFPLGTVDSTNVYPTGTIFQPCYWDGTTFTNGPTPRWVPQTQIARLKWRARQEVRRIQRWQGEIRQNYGRVYSSSDLAKIRDGLHFALVGLNRFLRGGQPLAVKETMLIGWAGGPTGAVTLPAFATAAVAATQKTVAYTWASWSTGLPIAIDATPPTGEMFATAPDPSDLLGMDWIEGLT